jgi:hypothetical protein
LSFQKPSRSQIHSHRAGAVGRAIVLYKKLWLKTIGPVLDSVLESERGQSQQALAGQLQSLSSHVDGLLQVMDRRMGALEADLIILTERVRQLERDGGASQEARLTNAAILDGRERLAQLKDEVEQLRSQLKPEGASGKRSVSRGS